MSERDIFTAARAMTDPAARSAYLDGSCGGDAGSRARVEALLRAHDQPDSLLDHPAVAPHDPDAGDTRTLAHEAGAPPDEDEVPLGFLAPATRPDSLGRIGHYEVLQVLGKGGFGIVFRAFDDLLHRVVAVKVLSPQMAATSPARKRFLREARSSAQVRHENVVQVYEVGEQPLPYIAMEFIPGETLQQRLDRTGPVEVTDVLRIGRQIAEGLAAAHATDLIHRDIKPGNVLLEGGAQRVKITDFGLARAADDASISQSGIIAGTPMFMAPEQAKGETLDQRADLFSLGSVLYQMAAGRPPFRANGTLAVLKRVAEDAPRPIREVIPETPQWLCDIIAKLHAKDPDDRYQSAREVADVLADCEAQLEANAKLKDYSRIPRSKRPAVAKTGRWKWVAAAVAVLACLGAWFGRAGVLSLSNKGELEILPEEGLVSVIVLRNDEGVLDDNKLHAPATDWLGMKERHKLTLPPGRYQVNVGTWPAGTSVEQWEVTSSGPFGSRVTLVPVVRTSAIITVDRGLRVTLRPKLRSAPAAIRSPVAAVELPTPTYKNGIGMEFAIVPKGKSWPGGGKDKLGDMEVQIPADFYLGKYEVTQEEWEKVMGENPSHFSRTGGGKDAVKDFSDADLKRFPVERVSWDDCQIFVAKLNQREKESGWVYRLPTSTEWEYACRGGPMMNKTDSAFDFYFAKPTNSLLLQKANFGNDDGLKRTSPVAHYQANRLGLFDMHGNVWEWCNDPKIEINGRAHRVLLGGAWSKTPVRCTARFRDPAPSTERHGDVGLRLARVPSGPPSPEAKTPPAIAPFTDADVKRIAALPAAEQVEEVRKELMRLNPGFDGKVETKIEDGVVTEIKVLTEQVTDIAPIRVFNALWVLDLSGTEDDRQVNGLLAGLTPLKGMNVSSLTRLTLFNTNIDDAGLAHFKDCKHLKNIGLKYTRVTDAGLVHFKDCKELREIDLGGLKVTDQGLAILKDCKEMTELWLNGTRMTDDGLAHFKDCKNLTVLHASRTQVTDAGLVHLKGCKQLATLFLDDTKITDAGLLDLAGLDKLTKLYLENTKVTAKAVEELAKALPKCKIKWDGGVIEPK